jgi:hypothetical protein
MRSERIANSLVKRVTGSDSDMEWNRVVDGMVNYLETLYADIKVFNFDDLDAVARWSKLVEKEQIDLYDEVVSREVDELRGELAKVLNEAESINRWWSDEKRKMSQKCQKVSQDVLSLAAKFKKLEKRS